MAHEKKPRGCFPTGCLILLVIAGLGIVALGAGYVFTLSKVRSATAEHSVELPAIQASQTDYQEVRQRLDNFARAAPGAHALLILPARDLNSLVALNPEWQSMRGLVYFKIADGKVAALGSFPLPDFPGLSGRHLNGVIYFVPSISHGVLNAKISKILLSAEPVADKMVQKIGPNLASTFCKQLMLDSVLGPVIRRADSVEIRNASLAFTAH